MVLPLGFLHPGTADPEDGHPPAVHSPDLYRLELATADEPESAEEQVVGLDHKRPRQSDVHRASSESGS